MEMIQYRPKRIKKANSLVVKPLGDIQWLGDGSDIAEDLLHESIEETLSRDGLFIGMGDYGDAVSPSNRDALRAARLYDNTRRTHDRTARWLMDDLYNKFLKKTKGRWLGLLEGHHFFELETGITTDQYLCEKLEAPHLGTSAYVGLDFKEWNSHFSVVNIWAHHGVGSGVSMAAPVTKLERVAKTWDADIYLLGHMTKQATAPINRIYARWPNKGAVRSAQLIHLERFLVGTGGFSKGYIEHVMQGKTPRGGYVEKGMMDPTVLGSPLLKITPRVVDKGGHGERMQYFKPKINVELGN